MFLYDTSSESAVSFSGGVFTTMSISTPGGGPDMNVGGMSWALSDGSLPFTTCERPKRDKLVRNEDHIIMHPRELIIKIEIGLGITQSN